MADVTRAFQLARGRDGAHDWGGLVLLIGAGCSASAGIPLGIQIAQDGMLELARAYSNGSFKPASPDAALDWLKQYGHIDANLQWSQAYGEIFESHFTDPARQRRVIKDAIDRGKGINWAHVCIGELVRCHYVHTVLTTNFDQLVLDGLVRAGLIPVVADGVEALSRIEGSPSYPQLVHIHGTRHTYRQRNSRSDVEETSRMTGVVGALRSLLLSSEALVVVGYAGGEEGLMRVLRAAADEAGEKTIYWVQYDSNPERLSAPAQELLGFSRGGGLVLGEDADGFFSEVGRALEIGVPEWMSAPVRTLASQATKLVPAKNMLIAGQVVSYQTLLQDLAGCLTQRETRSGPERQIDQAQKFALEGRTGEAQRVLDTQPGAAVPSELLESLADAAMTLGRQTSDGAQLERAVEGFRRALAALPPDRAIAVEIRLRTKHGEALTLLGQQKQVRDHLEEATKELRLAVELADPIATPAEFGEAQRALGTALLRLAYREHGTKLLDEGIEAYNRALQVYSRERMPLVWAKVQNNIGNALQKIADRTEDPNQLRRAADAYRNALSVFTQERLPDEWAATQNNLGNALQRIGWAENDDRALTDAITAYRASLEIYTATTYPVDWAMTQTNLGSVLQTIGRRTRRLENVRGALGAYHDALRVYTRDAFPLEWARTKDNIGNALRLLGEIEQDVKPLEEAVSAHEEALQVYGPDTVPHEWATAQHNLGVTRVATAERTGQSDQLDRALVALGRAQEVWTRPKLPVRWSASQRFVAKALLLRGKHSHDRRAFEEAASAATIALDPPIAGMNSDDHASLIAIRDAAHRALKELDLSRPDGEP